MAKINKNIDDEWDNAVRAESEPLEKETSLKSPAPKELPPVNPENVNPKPRKPKAQVTKRATPNPKIQQMTERRLLDTKILEKRSSRLPKVLGLSILFGVLAGLAIVIYLSKVEKIGNSAPPQITLPDAVKQNVENVPSTTTPMAPAPVPAAVKMVKILDTPTGYLNVRKGPGTNTEKIAQVAPGEQFEFVSENATGWYEIKLKDGQVGWITKQYAALQ